MLAPPHPPCPIRPTHPARTHHPPCSYPPPPPGEDIPEWFAFKSVVAVLREAIAEEAATSGSESSS